VSRAPSPNSGVTSVGETLPASWESITPSFIAPTGSFAAPVGLSPPSAFSSFGASLQVVTSPCCPRQLPDVISENLSLDAGPHTPAVHRVLAPVASTVSSAFPMEELGRLFASVPRTTSRRPGFSRLQVFRNVPASKFARPPGRSYRCEYCCRAAGAFTSGPIVLCCRRTYRIC
jgi:hypothetical protein